MLLHTTSILLSRALNTLSVLEVNKSDKQNDIGLRVTVLLASHQGGATYCKTRPVCALMGPHAQRFGREPHTVTNPSINDNDTAVDEHQGAGGSEPATCTADTLVIATLPNLAGTNSQHSVKAIG